MIGKHVTWKSDFPSSYSAVQPNSLSPSVFQTLACSFFLQDVRSVSPHLESGLTCDLIWPRECSERNGEPSAGSPAGSA